MDRIELENLAASDAGQQAAEDRRYDFSPPDRYCKDDAMIAEDELNAAFGEFFARYEQATGKDLRPWVCKECHGEGAVGTTFIPGIGPCDVTCGHCGGTGDEPEEEA